MNDHIKAIADELAYQIFKVEMMGMQNQSHLPDKRLRESAQYEIEKAKLTVLRERLKEQVGFSLPDPGGLCRVTSPVTPRT